MMWKESCWKQNKSSYGNVLWKARRFARFKSTRHHSPTPPVMAKAVGGSGSGGGGSSSLDAAAPAAAAAPPRPCVDDGDVRNCNSLS